VSEVGAVEEYLRSKGLDIWLASGGREITLRCVFCGETHRKGKFYINAEHGAWSCMVCGASGSFRQLMEHFGDRLDDDHPTIKPSRRLAINAEYLAKAQEHLSGSSRVLGYLHGRGFSDAAIEHFRLGYHPRGRSLVDDLPGLGGADNPGGFARREVRETGLLDEGGREFLEGRLIIPYLSSGQVVSLRGRQQDVEWGGKYVTLSGDQVRLFNADALRGADVAFLCEGEADCMLAWQHLSASPDVKARRIGVVAIPGAEALPGGDKGFPALFESVGRVYVCLDTDDAGRRAALRVREVLGSKARIVDLGVDAGDLGEYLAPAKEGQEGRGWPDLMRLMVEADMRSKRMYTVHEIGAQARSEVSRPGLKFGWASLDALQVPGLYPGGVGVILAKTGAGKAQPVSEPVLTPTGWCPMGELNVGDQVIGANGRSTRITGLYPQGVRDIYEVGFDDGSSVRVTGDHLWQVHTRLMKFQGQRPAVKTTLELLDELGGKRKWYVPMVAPVEFVSKRLPMDPYLLGVILGDGSLSSGHVEVSTDLEIVESLVLPEGVSLTRTGAPARSTCHYYRFCGLRPLLRQMGLLGGRAEDKFIPEDYLYASVADRTALLQGLLDTDGGAGRTSAIEYGTVSAELTKGVLHLVQSLGGRASIAEKWPRFSYRGQDRVGQKFYRMHLRLPGGVVPFRLARKREAWSVPTKYFPTRRVVAVKQMGREEAQCIKVAASDSLYVTRNFIVTHNTAVLNMMAWTNRHKPTLFITLELTRAQLQQRLIRVARFYFPALSEEQHEEMFSNLLIMDENAIGKGDFDQIVDEFAEERGGKPELVLLDHLTYMSHGMHGHDTRERTTNAIVEVKAQAKKHDLVLLVPAQVSRFTKEGSPVEQDSGRESGEIEELSDFLFGFWRPWEAVGASDLSQGQVQSELIGRILKSRLGNRGHQVRLHASAVSLVIVDPTDRAAVNKVEMENEAWNRGQRYEEIWHAQHQAALGSLQGALPPWERKD